LEADEELMARIYSGPSSN